MLDFALMLWLKLLFVDRIQPQSNTFATGVENEPTADSKRNESVVSVEHVHSHGLGP